MRILFFCWEYPPNGSGIGRYVYEMSTALREQGHYAIVVTSHADGYPEKENVDQGIVFRAFDVDEIGSIRTAKTVQDLARKYKVDWIEGAEHWGECAQLLKISEDRPPVIIKLHYNDVLLTPRYSQAWYWWQRWMIDLACLRRWQLIRGERYSMENANFLLAPCKRTLDEAQRQGISLPAKRAVLPNPIHPLPDFENQEAENPTILFVGRLDIGKGLPYIRPLLERLAPEVPDLRLEIAGGDSYARGLGSLRSWFKRQLGQKRSYVHFLNVLTAKELDEAYRRAWVVIVPSRWDNFPQVILEAMARGKAIVSSPNGGMPEMLTNTHNLCLDPSTGDFASAVLRFLQNDAERLHAGQSGREKVMRVYQPRKIVNDYIKALAG